MNITRKNLSLKIIITILRAAIGWHFLYEGVSKLLEENWTSKFYLENTTGFFSFFYHWLADTELILQIVDFLNVYGLILIGLGLFIGIFIRYASISGFILLTLYYFAYPPFDNLIFNPIEGHLFLIDKIFIEALVLLFLAITKEHGFSIDAFIKLKKNKPRNEPVAGNSFEEVSYSRREALKNFVTLPFLGLLGWGALTKRQPFIDVMTSATIKLKPTSISDLKGELPKGNIKNHSISRLVMGGNLIGGWAHSRDLVYVPELFKAYNTEKKIYETLMLAESAGINTINIGNSSNPILEKYKKISGSKIKVISQVSPDMNTYEYKNEINRTIDFGVDILQIIGNSCDFLVRDNKLDVIDNMLEYIRSQGYVAGLASHTIDALIACEENGIIPDYYMKTMHHDNYWSAHPIENRVPFEVDGVKHNDHDKFHDNVFCLFPERSVEFVNRTEVPVMGYKVLAAGAIEPEEGFKWAFENGADFICVGMFDFQIVKDVNITLDVLDNLTNRKREWFA
jgi:uncharacterized membrane protein YphA (DoxX/SURF4 family)